MPPKEIIRGGFLGASCLSGGAATGLMATLGEESNGLSLHRGQTSIIAGPVRERERQ